jgi:hypothetical protein
MPPTGSGPQSCGCGLGPMTVILWPVVCLPPSDPACTSPKVEVASNPGDEGLPCRPAPPASPTLAMQEINDCLSLRADAVARLL